MKIAQLAIGALDVQNLVTLGQQLSGQAGTERAGALNPEGFDLTEPGRSGF